MCDFHFYFIPQVSIMNSHEHSNWLVIPKPNPSASLRLMCFPYAGGGVSTYTSWVKYLPEFVELIFIQPPGRGARLLEPGYQSMDVLVKDLFVSIKRYFDDKPYVFFGHSMGARIAFELLRLLEASQINLPLHFVASGSPAPDHKMKESPMHLANDEEFIKRLRKLNGTPEEILQNDDLMALLLPALRADFTLAETYQCFAIEKIDCAVTVFRGLDDEWVDEKSAQRWSQFFIHGGNVEVFPGGHMFVEHVRAPVLDKLSILLAESVLINE